MRSRRIGASPLLIRLISKSMLEVTLMARDKAMDDKFFNCEQEHEDHYMVA